MQNNKHKLTYRLDGEKECINMRELKVKNDNIVRIANFFGIQVIGKFATYISDVFGYKEEEVITDIAFLDASGNTIVKRANLGVNISIPYNDSLSEKLESICYFLARKKYDAIDLDNIVNNLIYNSMALMNVKMHHEIRKEEEHNAKIAEVEKQIAIYETLENGLVENEMLFYHHIECKLYTLQFVTTEYKNEFLALKRDRQMEVLKNADKYDFISIGKTYNCRSVMYDGKWYYAGLKTT